MSIFGSIVNAIFGRSSAAGSAAGSGTSGSASATPRGTATAGQTPGTGSAGPTPGTASGARATPISREQLEEKIQKIADDSGRGEYNWDTSIVDLMKLLDLDSSLNARKQLAQELGYTGQLNGSAEMNIWLHKQVMTKMMESGGTVPADLR